ncbi:hypothetical protein FKM82_000068 [Ascaphus truei]
MLFSLSHSPSICSHQFSHLQIVRAISTALTAGSNQICCLDPRETSESVYEWFSQDNSCTGTTTSHTYHTDRGSWYLANELMV